MYGNILRQKDKKIPFRQNIGALGCVRINDQGLMKGKVWLFWYTITMREDGLYNVY